jgi:hypothetical protein
MKNRSLQTSIKMAVVMGLFLPLIETLRRSNQIMDVTKFFTWFDDYILGFILLGAAYSVKKQQPNAVSYLIAAWGIGVGALFLSFLAQFDHYAIKDPGIFPTGLVAIAKGMILGYMLIGLYLSIQANNHQ